MHKNTRAQPHVHTHTPIHTHKTPDPTHPFDTDDGDGDGERSRGVAGKSSPTSSASAQPGTSRLLSNRNTMCTPSLRYQMSSSDTPAGAGACVGACAPDAEPCCEAVGGVSEVDRA